MDGWMDVWDVLLLYDVEPRARRSRVHNRWPPPVDAQSWAGLVAAVCSVVDADRKVD
jgi:hypothetical protein